MYLNASSSASSSTAASAATAPPVTIESAIESGSAMDDPFADGDEFREEDDPYFDEAAKDVTLQEPQGPPAECEVQVSDSSQHRAKGQPAEGGAHELPLSEDVELRENGKRRRIMEKGNICGTSCLFLASPRAARYSKVKRSHAPCVRARKEAKKKAAARKLASDWDAAKEHEKKLKQEQEDLVLRRYPRRPRSRYSKKKSLPLPGSVPIAPERFGKNRHSKLLYRAKFATVREVWTREWLAQRKVKENDQAEVNYATRKSSAREAWASLGNDAQRTLVNEYLDRLQTMNQVREDRGGLELVVLEDPLLSADKVQKRNGHGYIGYLLTWNTDCGVDDPSCRAAWAALKLYPPDSSEFLSVMEEFRRIPYVVSALDRFKEYCLNEAYRSAWTECSCCLEVSLASKVPGRFHYHCYVSRLSQRERTVLKGEDWVYRDALPHVAANETSGRGGRKRVCQGHYYNQVDKIGHLIHFSNFVATEAFYVESTWLMGWWRAKKILSSVLQNLLIAHRCKNSKNYIREVTDNAHDVQEIEDLKSQIIVQDKLSHFNCSFKKFPAIEEWKKQYVPVADLQSEGAKMLGRFKFLVLKGPSRMGKTQLASSLFERKRTLLTGCQNAKEPNLAGYKKSQHRCIVYDEAGPAMVVSNKVLFQASSDDAMLCQSQCQQHTKRYFLYSVPMVICTNKWIGDEGVKLDAEDTEWLESNSVVVEINEPCWIEN